MPESQEPKKKLFVMLQAVKDFLRPLPIEVKQELNDAIFRLERDGFLAMPYGEKITGESDLFAIRVIQTANVRVFYAYGIGDLIYGLHGYVKKTEQIPQKELKYVKKVLKQLKEIGGIK